MRRFLSLVLLVQLVLNAGCYENNNCHSYKDFYSIEDNPNCYYDVAVDSSVPDVIQSHGYPVEAYTVATLDGYILTVFRIPNHNQIENKGPVFLQHGWHASSGTFTAQGKESLAFVLADAGYDVWLGNYRGSQYSEDHVNLTVHDQHYWDYSYDEIGLYDIPAMLELVVQTTGQRGNIVYIGHSLGTTVGMVYGSTYPQLAKATVKLFIFLAPAAAIPHTRSLIGQAFKFLGRIAVKFAESNDLMRLFSQAKVLQYLSRAICSESPLLLQRCTEASNLLLYGLPTRTGAYASRYLTTQQPAGVSFKIVGHLGDNVKGRFGRFDYGKLGNLEKYGTLFPPEYDVAAIDVPVYLVYGVNDWIATEEDTLILYKKLSRKARSYGYFKIGPPFNHLDYLFGKDIKSVLYDSLLKLIEEVKH